MFWSKNQQDKKKQGKRASGCERENRNSQRLRDEALANARAARENIGEETLDKIAAMMTQKQQSATERARRQINEADPDKVLDELLLMLRSRE